MTYKTNQATIATELKETKMIEIYTDGACRNNGTTNALGAFAYRLIYGTTVKDYSEAVPATTNNRMELSAVIMALRALKRVDLPITVYSDSTYVVNGASKWLYDWEKKAYKKVKNSELWKELLTLIRSFQIPPIFTHIEGHAGNPNNEAVDKLCNKAMDECF